MIIKKVYLSVLILFLCGCGNNHKTRFAQIDHIGENKILYERIMMDTIRLDSCNTSFLIESQILGDYIYMIDKRFCWVYQFDSTGHLSKRMLGQGKSNREIQLSHIEMSTAKDNRVFFMGSTNDIHIFRLDSTLIKEDVFPFRRDIAARKKHLKKHENPNIYSAAYDKLTTRVFGNKFYYSIQGNHPLFNIFIPGYFDQTALIAEVNMENRQVDRVFGNLSPEIKKHNGKNQFSMFDYDMDEQGNFYICYELDSLMYVLDSNANMKNSFGFGANISFDNHKSLDILNFRKFYMGERDNKCYYDRVKVIGDYIFRTYRKGAEYATDGLQIYKNFDLVGDVEIPKNSWIIGQIGPWYYTNLVADENTEKVYVYRFKIN